LEEQIEVIEMNAIKTPKDLWRIGINNTALVVIDMQRAFLDEGSPLECLAGREIVPKINRLAASCRHLKMPVIFVKADRRADLSDSGLFPDFADFASCRQNDEMDPRQGRRGNEFCESLNVTKDDYIVPKIRYSALIPGSSSLEPLLRGLGRDRFIISGVATDVCVGATTIDGMMLGFKVFFGADLTATFSEERQKIALEVYDRHFAKVMSFNEVMDELTQLAREREAQK
jgi:ureidoacrylate peracid hydrolase